MRSVAKFLEGGDKVKVTLRFRGREMAHQELGPRTAGTRRRGRQGDRQGRNHAQGRRPPDGDDGRPGEITRQHHATTTKGGATLPFFHACGPVFRRRLAPHVTVGSHPVAIVARTDGAPMATPVPDFRQDDAAPRRLSPSGFKYPRGDAPGTGAGGRQPPSPVCNRAAVGPQAAAATARPVSTLIRCARYSGVPCRSPIRPSGDTVSPSSAFAEKSAGQRLPRPRSSGTRHPRPRRSRPRRTSSAYFATNTPTSGETRRRLNELLVVRGRGHREFHRRHDLAFLQRRGEHALEIVGRGDLAAVGDDGGAAGQRRRRIAGRGIVVGQRCRRWCRGCAPPGRRSARPSPPGRQSGFRRRVARPSHGWYRRRWSSRRPSTRMSLISAIPASATSTLGIASRALSVGISVWPPPSACAPSSFSASTASATVFGFAISNAYIARSSLFRRHAADAFDILPRGGHDRLDDVVVAGAAADVAVQVVADLGLGRLRVVLQQRRSPPSSCPACRSRIAARGDPGTPAARRQRAVAVGHALDRGDLGALRLAPRTWCRPSPASPSTCTGRRRTARCRSRHGCRSGPALHAETRPAASGPRPLRTPACRSPSWRPGSCYRLLGGSCRDLIMWREGREHRLGPVAGRRGPARLRAGRTGFRPGYPRLPAPAPRRRGAAAGCGISFSSPPTPIAAISAAGDRRARRRPGPAPSPRRSARASGRSPAGRSPGRSPSRPRNSRLPGSTGMPKRVTVPPARRTASGADVLAGPRWPRR